MGLMNNTLLSTLILIGTYMFGTYVCLVLMTPLFPVFSAICFALTSVMILPSLYVNYRFRNGIEKSAHSLRLPTLNGYASIVKADIKGFKIKKSFLGRVSDYVNLTIYLKSGSEVEVWLPDYIVEQAQEEVELGVE